MSAARVTRVTGALVQAAPMRESALYELVRVGAEGLLGEVIRVDGDTATIQVYEETSGLALGEPVARTEGSLALELGPGLLGSVLDGVGRPLDRIGGDLGNAIAPGATAPTLDRSRRWEFVPLLSPGARVSGGDVLGTVDERPGFPHTIMVPPGVDGVLSGLRAGAFTVDDAIGELAGGVPLRLAQTWPVRTPRPARARPATGRPFVTGQRILDFLFPVAEGGSVAVPGGFGTGKTVIEQSLAKFATADVVVYIGCGERGNEMAEVLGEFPRLLDPRTGRPLIERMLLIANTSNMPIVAREASIYLGMTAAEYFRDMGLRVAILADSLSRWAEALREIGSRLQEMPGEEGFPTYLSDRLAKLYERAGSFAALGAPPREGAITFISAISPPGGDFSEPVTQSALRVAGALWALDAGLAHRRQFPAVDWETSYSLYEEQTLAWFSKEVAPDWESLRREILALLQRDGEVREIAGLVGADALQDEDRLALETARIVREAVLAQSAFDPGDAVSTPAKTHLLASLAVRLLRAGRSALAAGVPFERLDLEPVRRVLVALRARPEDELAPGAAEAGALIGAIEASRGRA